MQLFDLESEALALRTLERHQSATAMLCNTELFSEAEAEQASAAETHSSSSS